ncbi:hypothetical protein D3OALGA1CA_4733 [Olavius algarvensis associated proteobacterium Delta 3]|nr:hypothetical protein D3OALGB2SA_2008 [Olavius algarvensis associated proteobacterium Delta 3]CAB5156041.1 hypothetical protein D3OALGA1CA_4733 [Olavius algarvensis associated proteobacterium Delta 3]
MEAILSLLLSRSYRPSEYHVFQISHDLSKIVYIIEYLPGMS